MDTTAAFRLFGDIRLTVRAGAAGLRCGAM